MNKGKYPCFVEINYETASKQVEKLNKEEQEKLIFEQIFVALKFGILKA